MPDSKPAYTPQQELTIVAGLLHEVGHLSVTPLGIELIGCLIDGPRDVSTLANMTDNGIASVSKKLADLRHAGLLSCHVEGSRHVYQLADGLEVVTWNENRAVVAKVPGGMLAVGVSRELLDRLRQRAGPPALTVKVRPGAATLPATPTTPAPPSGVDATAPM